MSFFISLGEGAKMLVDIYNQMRSNTHQQVVR